MEDQQTNIVNVSAMFNYCGSMTKNREIEYPGEEVFGGMIGYGMNDGTPYDALKGSCTAVLGNGAFAVENIRTCCEFEAEKCYLITRRKNLASPRVACWFAHQGPAPTPARLILKMFEPMYKLAGFGDPWEFWSIHASKDRMNVTIIQNSRFGIGDVTFLAMIYGKAEYVEDLLKRCSRLTLHLVSGRTLHNVNNIIKSLGLIGDFEVDRLHKMKQMVGSFCDGDWRRTLTMDAPGMNAANFTSFSVLGSIGFSRTQKYILDHPKEFFKIQGDLMPQLPVHRAEEKEEKPAYVYGVKHAMAAGILLESMMPKVQQLGALDGEYKHKLYHASHPTDYMLKQVKASWDAYQETWQAQGSNHEYVPYPYTRAMIDEYFQEYSKHWGFVISPDGYPKDQLTMSKMPESTLGNTPEWASNAGAMQQAENFINTNHKEWWSARSSQLSLFKKHEATNRQAALP